MMYPHLMSNSDLFSGYTWHDGTKVASLILQRQCGPKVVFLAISAMDIFHSCVESEERMPELKN